MTEAALRSNLRSVLEMETTLATCEETTLVERNKDHKQSWLLIQSFLKGFKSYIAEPKRESLQALSESISLLKNKVKEKGVGLYDTIAKLHVEAQFLQTVVDKDIHAAVLELDLDNPNCMAKQIYTQYLQVEPSTAECGSAEEWIESSILEAAAKDVLRTLDVSTSTRHNELRRAGVFFTRYQEAVSTIASLPAALKRRADAMSVLSDSMLGENVRSAASVNMAVQTLTSNKKHELCKAYEHYKAGKEYMIHASSLAGRHADDIIGDTNLEQAGKEVAMDENEGILESPALMVEKVGAMSAAVLRLTEALTVWSELRLEEQLPGVRTVCHQIAAIPLVLDFSMAASLCKSGGEAFSAIVHALAENPWDSADAPLPLNTARELKMVRGVITRVRTQLESVESSLQGACEVAERFLTNTLGKHMKSRKLLKDLNLDPLLKALQCVPKRRAVLTSLLSAVSCMITLQLDYGVVDYPTASKE